MLLAALPGRAVQLAHAILAAGYDLVVPVSWGEELLAEHVLRELEHAPSHAMVFCSCPLVRQRLLASGNEIVPHLLSTVAPPVATARYLRALQPDVGMRITYLGACPGAVENSIDAQLQPQDFLHHLDQRAISIVRQPMVFESMVPPDRRRHWSVPGGAPSVDAMVARGLATRFVTVGPDVALEIAEAILAADRVLLDVAPTQGCACAGAVEVHQVEGSREAVIALEPPRSHLPVIDVEPRIAVAHTMPHLTGHSGTRIMRSGSTPFARPAQPTPLHEAARSRSERRRMAITPPHISTTDARGRPATPSSEAAPMLPSARRAHAAAPRDETAPRRPEGATTAPAAHVDAAAPSPVAPIPTEAPAGPPTEVPHAPEAPGGVSAPAPVAQVHEDEVDSRTGIAVRRRTPTYEMRHVARSRSSHTGETPRVPRAYGAVRSRVRAGDAMAATDAVPEHHLAPAGPPISASQPALEVSTAIPVVDPPTPAPVDVAGLEPGARGIAFAPRLARHDAPAARRSRSWLVALALVLVAGAIGYVLLRR